MAYLFQFFHCGKFRLGEDFFQFSKIAKSRGKSQQVFQRNHALLLKSRYIGQGYTGSIGHFSAGYAFFYSPVAEIVGDFLGIIL